MKTPASPSHKLPRVVGALRPHRPKQSWKRSSEKSRKAVRWWPKTAALLLYLCIIPFTGTTYSLDEDVLVMELWTEYTTLIPNLEDGLRQEGRLEAFSEDEAIRRVLEEARVVISAMLYGYEVEYTPLDRARGMEERLVVEPIAQIERGDPGLRALDTRAADGRLYVRIRYDLKDHQIRRRNSWKSNTYPSVTASGSVSLSKGPQGKLLSFEEAVKEGLRAYLRPKEYNKPREIVGKVLFLDPPYTRLDAGGYHSKVRMKLKIDEVVPYGAY
ncbi:MAG: hypothetical protein ACLFMZ_09795 [Spirochaetaceae bacterium]